MVSRLELFTLSQTSDEHISACYFCWNDFTGFTEQGNMMLPGTTDTRSHKTSQNHSLFFLRAVVTMVGRSDLVFLVCGFHHQLFLLINPTCEVCCKPKKMENYKKKTSVSESAYIYIYIYTLYTRVIKRHVRKDIKIDIESRGDGEGRRRRRRRRRRSKATPEDQNTRTPNIRTPQHAKHENANAITPLTPEHHQHQKTRTPKHHEARMPRQ